MIELEPAAETSASFVVLASATAATFAEHEDESYPAVLSTPHLIGSMERTCAALMAPHLHPGQMSVGAAIDIRHKAPTAVGAAYTCRATFVEREGPLYWFDVTAEDNAGQIGKGRIARAVVNETDILRRAALSVEQKST